MQNVEIDSRVEFFPSSSGFDEQAAVPAAYHIIIRVPRNIIIVLQTIFNFFNLCLDRTRETRRAAAIDPEEPSCAAVW